MIKFGSSIACLIALLALCMGELCSGAEELSGPVVRKVEVAGVVNPVLADFISAELARANDEGARAFLVELDTPGGLDTSMRTIIQAIFASDIPVIVYVYPPGARAASAGALIALAADFTAMAPGTNVGAAHPVAIGPGSGDANETMMAKVVADAVAYARSIAQKRGRSVDWAERIVRDSVSSSAAEALEEKVIDLIAEDEQELLKALHGKSYLRQGQKRVLDTEGVRLLEIRMSWRQEILDTISNPNVAYMLLMLGILGIFFEISQPGVILPGVVGAIALLLAFFAFQTLPVNYAGVLLILLAIVLFVLEIKVTSYGMLSVGGIVSLSLGSLMLIESSEPYLQISRAVIFATVGVFSAFTLLILFFVMRTQGRRFASGREGLVGERGEAVSDIDGEGRVFVHGEYWLAVSRLPIAKGQKVVVCRVMDNMRLEVEALSGE